MATYLLNILPSKTLAYQSPLQILYRKDPSYSHLRIFGCLCYPLFPSTTINKLQPRSTPCVFLGYPSNHRGYTCYDLSSSKIIICRHVLFDETQFPFSALHTPPSTTYDFLDHGISPFMINHFQNEAIAQNVPQPQTIQQAQSPTLSPAQNEENTDLNPHSVAQSATATQLPDSNSLPSSTVGRSFLGPHSDHTQPLHLPPIFQPTTSSDLKPVTRSQHGIFKANNKYQHGLLTHVTKSPLPRNPVSALKDPNWKMAIDDEYNALITNKTWDLVPRPPDVNVIRSMWSFRHTKI